MRKVFITTTISQGATASLMASAHVQVHSEAAPPTRAALIRGGSGCFALICTSRDVIDAAVLDATGVRLVATLGEGADNVDLEAARARRVWVTHTPGLATEAVADLALTMLLALTRRVVETDRRWRALGRRGEQLEGQGLSHRTLGIIGLGRIGRAVARRARAFGLRILFHGGHAAGVTAEPRDLDSLLAESDLVSVHARLTPKSIGLLGARELARMRDHAVLVNTARAALIDGDALVAALAAGRLGGVGLDIGGPGDRDAGRLDERLLGFERVLLTPRIGALTDDTFAAMGERAAEQVLTALAGTAPPDRLV